MFQYIIKRLLLLFVTLFGIAVITFVLTRLTPGDPAAMRVQGASGGASQAVGGYDDLVELNRRNLGLDKPLLLNLNFEDRVYLAKEALDDYLRQSEFWSDDGERRLARISTIALKPALERFSLIGTDEEPVPRRRTGEEIELVSEKKRRQLLADIYPRLAAAQGIEPEGLSAEETHQFWSDWYADNQELFEEERVGRLVRQYVEAESNEEAAALQKKVYQAGGFAVPYLIGYLGTDDRERLLRVNRALQSQTGFTYVLDEENFEEIAGRVEQRWRSWWRREKAAYLDYTWFGDTLNIFRNTQFGLWVAQAAHLDFGDSYVERRPVISLIAEALPISLMISGISIFLSYLISVPIGIFSAIKRRTPTDNVVTVILFLLYSLPPFWVAGILLLLTTGPPFLDLFPTRGLNSEGVYLGAEDVTFLQWFLDRLWHLILPVLCLTYGSLAFLSRQMRSSMLETINQDYIRTAQAKGLPARWVIFKHALRNSLIPILTISAGLLPELIAGAVIIESIFTIPGMGTLTFEAIVQRDYPVINAVLFFSAFLTLLGILLADLSYAIADPRISYS